MYCNIQKTNCVQSTTINVRTHILILSTDKWHLSLIYSETFLWLDSKYVLIYFLLCWSIFRTMWNIAHSLFQLIINFPNLSTNHVNDFYFIFTDILSGQANAKPCLTHLQFRWGISRELQKDRVLVTGLSKRKSLLTFSRTSPQLFNSIQLQQPNGI